MYDGDLAKQYFDSILQSNAHRHTERMILSAVQTIDLAVEANRPNLQQIAHNAFQNYLDAMMLLKDFIIREINPYPDHTWDGIDMKVFDTSYQEMLEMLSADTKTELKNKGITL